MNGNWEFTKPALLDMESKLKCFICEKLPVNPHILWCKHSFCKDCILSKETCPKCDFSVIPQDMVPDIMLNHLLQMMQVTSGLTKCGKNLNIKILMPELYGMVGDGRNTNIEYKKPEECHTSKILNNSNSDDKSSPQKQSTIGKKFEPKLKIVRRKNREISPLTSDDVLNLNTRLAKNKKDDAIESTSTMSIGEDHIPASNTRARKLSNVSSNYLTKNKKDDCVFSTPTISREEIADSNSRGKKLSNVTSNTLTKNKDDDCKVLRPVPKSKSEDDCLLFTPTTSRGKIADSNSIGRKFTSVMSIALTKNKKSDCKVSTPKSKSTPKCSSPMPHTLFSAKKPQIKNKVNIKGETPLQIACRQGKLDKVQQLLKEGADPNVKDYANWTPLCDAVGSGKIEVVKALLEAGAGVNTPSNLNTTALVEAVVKREKDMIRLLMSYGADMHQRTALNNTAISLADDDIKDLMTNITGVAIRPPPRVMTVAKAVLVYKLSQVEIDKVKDMCVKFNLTLTTVFTDDITHIVVEKTANNTCVGSTVVMLGIVNGCSVVGMDWVTACLEANVVIAVDDFEPTGTNDYQNSNAFYKARLNKECLLPRLFDGCHISLQHDQIWSSQLKNDIGTLVQAAGAQYQPRACDAERIPKEEQTVMFHTQPNSSLYLVSHIILYQPGQHEPLLKYNMTHVKSFSVSWFLQCIKTFSIPYVQEMLHNH